MLRKVLVVLAASALMGCGGNSFSADTAHEGLDSGCCDDASPETDSAMPLEAAGQDSGVGVCLSCDAGAETGLDSAPPSDDGGPDVVSETGSDAGDSGTVPETGTDAPADAPTDVVVADANEGGSTDSGTTETGTDGGTPTCGNKTWCAGSCDNKTGVCTVASGLQFPKWIAVNDTTVWVTSGSVADLYSAPLAGGSGSLATYPTTADPNGIAAYGSDQTAFWTDGASSVLSEAISGSQNTVETDTTSDAGANSTGRITLDGTNIYWTDYGNGGVFQAARGGGSVITLAASQKGPLGVAVYAKKVYWTNYDDGTVMSAPIGGGARTTIMTGLTNPYSVAVDATGVYITDPNGGLAASGTVTKCHLGGGCSPTTFIWQATGQDYPYDIVSDGTNVYWTNGNGFAVMTHPTNSLGAAVPFVTTTGKNVYGLAVDSTSVYWAAASDGLVAKKAKL